MEMKLQIILIVLCIATLAFIINMVKKERLELKYAVSWIIVNILVLILAIVPRSMDVISYILGIITPINALFFLGFIFVLIILFSLTVAQSRSSKKIAELTQYIALLEERIKR